jgi:hypothetical protein
MSTSIISHPRLRRLCFAAIALLPFILGACNNGGSTGY